MSKTGIVVFVICEVPKVKRIRMQTCAAYQEKTITFTQTKISGYEHDNIVNKHNNFQNVVKKLLESIHT